MSISANRFQPQSITTYQYWAYVDRVVDGDTVDLTVSLGFDISVKHRFRLLGIDAPEIFSQRLGSAERVAGEAAKRFLEEQIPAGSWVEIKVHISGKREKYGRWLAAIFKQDVNINQLMVNSGHATALHL